MELWSSVPVIWESQSDAVLRGVGESGVLVQVPALLEKRSCAPVASMIEALKRGAVKRGASGQSGLSAWILMFAKMGSLSLSPVRKGRLVGGSVRRVLGVLGVIA